MPILSPILASYVPALTIKRYLAEPAPLMSSRREMGVGAVLFADISGFTALTEHLSQQGPDGLEELTLILNTYFGRFIDLVYDHGGDVLKFAGDALLAVWPQHETSEAMASLVMRAIQCGVELQSLPSDLSLRAMAPLTLRVSVGAGEFSISDLGGAYGRWELMVTGSAITEIGLVAHDGEPGELVLTPRAWQAVQHLGHGTTLPSGGTRLDTLHETIAQRALVVPDLPPEGMEAFSNYVPGAVKARLAAGQTQWLSEQRQATILFVKLPGLETAPLEQAQAVMAALQENIYHFEGSINKLNADEKGVTLLAAMGLPPLAHGDDAYRAVRAALVLHDRLAELGIDSSIGVATGRVFCGELGNDRRREYTVLGDVVNLAARLMGAAGGGVWCDGNTQQAARAQIRFEAMPSVHLKGKLEPVPVFRPIAGDLAPKTKQTGTLLGRTAERNLLSERLGSLVSHRKGGVVLIEADAGLGKSHLVEAFLAEVREQAISVHVGRADAIESAVPYLVWGPVLTTLLFPDLAFADREDLRQAISLKSAKDPDFGRLAPLLGQILQLDLPDNDLTVVMQGQVRGDNIHDLVLNVLRTAAEREPLVVVLEDGHWMDSASWTLAALAAEQLPSLLLVMTSRPLGATPPAEWQRLREAPHAAFLTLNGLTYLDTERLILDRLGALTVPDAVTRSIWNRAEGNPFFSTELLLALRESGQVAVVAGEWRLSESGADLAALDLPSTVEGTITSRLDRLTPNEQMVLKIASVIGRSFTLTMLLALHPQGMAREVVLETLAQTRERDLIALDADASEPTYVFRHMITCEVVYQQMLLAQRQPLHQAVAEWYEQEADSTKDTVLAHHWKLAARPDRAVTYLMKAGEAALQAGANQEAIALLADALPLLGTESRDVLARGTACMGRAYLALGRHDDGITHLERALSLWGNPVPDTNSGLWAAILREAVRQALYRLGIRQADTGLSFETVLRMRHQSAAYEALIEAYFYRTLQLRQAFSILCAVNLAEKSGSTALMAHGYAGATALLYAVSLYSVSHCYYHPMALEKATASGDPAAMCRVVTMGGLYLRLAGRLHEAIPSLKEGLRLSHELGDKKNQAVCQMVLASIYGYIGDFKEALAIYADVYDEAKRTGNVQRPPEALTGIGMCQIYLGMPALAIDTLAAVPPLLETCQDPTVEVEYLCVLAQARLHNDEPEEARRLAFQALERVRHAAPNSYNFQQTYRCLSEVVLTLYERAPSAELADAVRDMMHQLMMVIPFQKVYRPFVMILVARAHWLNGQHRHATKLWRMALKQATRLENPYLISIVHLELGRRRPTGKMAPRRPLRISGK